MGESSRGPSSQAVLGCIEDVADEGEPLTAAEVAEATGSSPLRVTERLDELVRYGDLHTKEVAGVRTWWLRHRDVRALNAEQVLEVEYHTEALAGPFLEAGADDVTVSFDSMVPLPDGTQLQYYTAEGIEPDVYLGIIDEYSNVLTARLLSVVGDTVRVEVHADFDTISTVFADAGGAYRSVSLEDGVMRIVGEVPGSVDPAAFTEAVEAVVPDAVLVSERLVHTPRLFRDLVEERLTDRQRAALRTAYYAGYFGSPRTSTGDDLARSLGVTRQTFHHHLRRAEQVTFEQLFEGSGEDAL